MYKMNYIGTDFLHNIEGNRFLKEIANGEYLCYIMVSSITNHVIIAIPRFYIYNHIKCKDTPDLCDIFKVNKHLPFSIQNEEICFENEAEIKKWAMSFTKDICTIQRNIADISTTTYLNILERIKEKESLPVSEGFSDYCEKEIRITSEYNISTKQHIIKNEKGEILISLKHHSSQISLFQLIKNNINGILHTLKKVGK